MLLFVSWGTDMGLSAFGGQLDPPLQATQLLVLRNVQIACVANYALIIGLN